jgi:formamidopyrimidine-DNA glycosylase
VPELPEVETIVADLRPQLLGAAILGCQLRFPAIVRHPEPEDFAREVAGRSLEALTRRGKYILGHLDSGRLLVIHLGMTGHLQLFEPEAEVSPHTHAIFELSTGAELRYRDPRRFGRLLLGHEAELVAARRLPSLGLEPLDPGYPPDDLHRRLRRRRAPLKALLLDQSVVAGVGNIYADEACFRAGIRPSRPAGRVSRQAAARLHGALRESLSEAIANRGSSVATYLDGLGQAGGQQFRLQVYGRGGQPCLRCGRPLASERLAGRTTVFCRYCQR